MKLSSPTPLRKDINPALAAATSLPDGAHFFRCALQVNPPHYGSTFQGQATVDPEAYVDQLLAEAVVNNIQVLGITDHNDVSSVDRIAARAKERGIVVFPGFEVMSSEGIHVLCLFDPGTTEADLRPHLYGLGVKTVGPSSDLCECTFVQVLEHIANRGGICIAAHVVHHNGLLYETSGKARIANWRSPHLLAVQIPGRVDDLGPDYKQIITNVDPEHKRYPARGRSLAVAVINAKDVKTPSDLAHQAATTFIKMTIPSVEGLRQAFLDPDSRIRLNGQEIPETRADIVAVSWEAGFLDGCGVHFNENLNVLIGGRGAGKSSVIESIRWALGVEPLGDEAKKQHESMLKHVVPSGTKVSILVRTREPDEKHYVIERSAPNPPVVRDAATGQISNLTPHRVLRADIFGQHELSELSGSKEHLTRLLDRFVQPDPQLTARKSDVRRRLEASRRQTMAVTKELLDIGERLATLPSLEETLKRYQDAGVESRLMEQGVLVREERVLTTADERLGRFDEMIADLGRELPLDTLFLSDRALADLPGKEILAGARQAMDTMSTGAMTAHKTLTKALADARNQMASVRAAWKVRKEGAQKAYEKALRELQQSRIDGAQYVELKRNLENLRPLVERKSALERDLRELRQNRADLALEWEDLKRSEFQRLQKAAKAIGRKLDQGVAVDVNFGGKRTPLIQLLSKRINNFSSAAKATLDRDGMSLTELSASCRAGKIEVEKRFNLSPVMAERIAELGEELAMEIEELELPTTTSVSLNVAPLGQPINLRPLEELSAGQRATALLLIVLLESDGPLIVDQPEDDLDNRFITEGVVPRMKDEKRRRQFIFATHNANIPVLADAELIIGLSARARSAEMSPDLMGSIDTKAVRSLVETQLEGGKEAFELRRLKYGYQNA